MVNNYLLYTFAGLAFVLAMTGLLHRPRRAPLWLAAASAAGAAAAANADSFWSMTMLAIVMLCAVIVALPLIDFSWRMRASIVTAGCLFAGLALWPSVNVMSKGQVPCPDYIKEKVGFRLVAGLDLRGGLRLVYTVDVDQAIKDKRDHYYDDMRTELAKIYLGHTGEEAPSDELLQKLSAKVELTKPRTDANSILLHVKDGTDASKIDARFRDLFKPDLEAKAIDKTHFEFSIRESAGSGIRERAVAQAREIILRRVDQLGLREASVSTRDEDIIIEVPGENEAVFAEIRDTISKTARLEFKLNADTTDFFQGVKDKATPASLPEGLEWRTEAVPVGTNDKGEVVRSVITYAYLKIKEGEKAQDTLVRFKEWAAQLEVPQDREIGYELESVVVDQTTLEEKEDGWRTYFLHSRAEITGDMISDAAAVPDQSDQGLGGWHVQLDFSPQGGKIFSKITGANVHKRFSIILDGRVASSPEILSKITGGRASITMGRGDPQAQLKDSKQLELVLRSGALPAPISPSNEQRIGPSLGQESIELGVEGALGGGLLVLIFMWIYYERAGTIANIAVTMNLFWQLAVLASFGASMTLPGIAGLALTIGMSVDANVLINERIREEIKAGKSPRAAVELGFNRAFSAIMDGQVTTLIAGAVLAQYGTGPIKGFAVTLMIGTVCSIFTGIVVSRVLFDLWVRGFGKRLRFNMG
ncbi:MAG TPA: protein translocase subunit SecD [Polyangiaceae bacterium]